MIPIYNLLIDLYVPSFIRYVRKETPYFTSPDAYRLKNLLFPVIPSMLFILLITVVSVMFHIYRKQRRFR